MAPAEVLCQSGHLSLLRSCLDESDHVEKVLAAEAGPIFGRQLSRQRRDNLISVFRPGIAEDIAPYPAPNLPVEHHEFRVDGSRHTKPSCFDQATQVSGQLAENSRRWRWALLALLPSLVCVAHLPPRFTITCWIVRWRASCGRSASLRRSGGNEPVVSGKSDSIRTVHCSKKLDTARCGQHRRKFRECSPLPAGRGPRPSSPVVEHDSDLPAAAILHSECRLRSLEVRDGAEFVERCKQQTSLRFCYQTCYHFLEKAA